jgi:hypothetical protein
LVHCARVLCCDEVDLWRAAEGIDELEEPDFAAFSVCEDLIEGDGNNEWNFTSQHPKLRARCPPTWQSFEVLAISEERPPHDEDRSLICSRCRAEYAENHN